MVEIYKVLEIAKVLNICILPAIVRRLPPQHLKKIVTIFLSLYHNYYRHLIF